MERQHREELERRYYSWIDSSMQVGKQERETTLSSMGSPCHFFNLVLSCEALRAKASI